jgi:hypothetical protein
MTRMVVIFALSLSAANWLLFVGVIVVTNLATIRQAFRHAPLEPGDRSDAPAHARQVQLDQLVDSTGSLARSLRIAGPASSAAAMSLACLVIAAVCAGLDKL